MYFSRHFKFGVSSVFFLLGKVFTTNGNFIYTLFYISNVFHNGNNFIYSLGKHKYQAMSDYANCSITCRVKNIITTLCGTILTHSILISRQL